MTSKRLAFLALALAPGAAFAQSAKDLEFYSQHLASCERNYQERVANQCGAGERGARCRDDMLRLSRNCVANAEARLERARLRAIKRNEPPRY